MMKFWAYRHVNGGIHVKSYWGKMTDDSDPDLDDAFESPFVDKVLYPYEAENREEAEKIAKDRLKVN